MLLVAPEVLHQVLKIDFVKRVAGGHPFAGCFTVQCHLVFQTLQCLRTNNPFYMEVVIDEKLLEDLPVDGVPADWKNLWLTQKSKCRGNSEWHTHS